LSYKRKVAVGLSSSLVTLHYECNRSFVSGQKIKGQGHVISDSEACKHRMFVLRLEVLNTWRS